MLFHLFIRTSWLPQRQATYLGYPAVCLCVTFQVLLHISWMLHTHIADINWLSHCSPMNCSIHETFIMHISWQLHRQTTDITWLSNSLSMRSISSICSCRYLQYFTRLFCRYLLVVQQSMRGPFHLCILAVCCTLLFQIHPDCPTVYPQIVLFVRHLFMNMFQMVQEDNF